MVLPVAEWLLMHPWCCRVAARSLDALTSGVSSAGLGGAERRQD